MDRVRREALVTESFERAAERCEDLTPLVYERLFRQSPEMLPHFWRDTNGAIKGEMLSRVIEAILDFVGERKYAHHLIQCEVVTHAGYDVPPEVFATFFGTVAATMKALLGRDWTPDVDEAWTTLLADLDFYVKHPDQSLTPA
ncbi:MAG TPA: globin domain-containing protein [Caulobacteraceae bacterium]|nr:globin domain-containing protein [Caulobacteraceae bacterium]